MAGIEKIPIIIIGAGVIGCAIAHTLAINGHVCWILEAGSRIAGGVTSRNSGVIHAGIYYPTESLKAQCCVRGKELLYEWCRARNLPHCKTGKWIIGNGVDDEADLLQIFERALEVGATGLSWAKPADLMSLAHVIRFDRVLYSAETGIVDAYALSRSFIQSMLDYGGKLLTDTKVLGITSLSQGGYELVTNRGLVQADSVINAAGLYSDEVAKLAGVGYYNIYPWRGDYFKLSKRYCFEKLIYPVKKKNVPGLGIHLTIDLAGQCKLGPDVTLARNKEDFLPHENKRENFFKAASTYLRDLQLSDLSYDFCGIRPKLRSPADLSEHDFVISEDLPGFINLVGIESPGLTACLAIAEKVYRLL